MENDIEKQNTNESKIERNNGPLVRILPSAVTISAFCAGLTAIRFALFQKWELAIVCVFIAALLDACDGKVARFFRQSSQFGAELDSLSDLVCFGVAPAMILFLSTMYKLSGLGWGICMFYTICCSLRLARFNATQIQNTTIPDWAKKYFTGVPAPAGAVLALFPLILYFQTEDTFFINVCFVSSFLILSGILMVSTLKTFSSKMIEVRSGQMLLALMIICFLIICLITEPWLTLTVLILVYILLIPFGSYEYYKLRKKEENTESGEE